MCVLLRTRKARAPGQEDGPRALREAGLVERLETAGVAARRGGRVTLRWRPDADNPKAANAGAVIDRASQVAARVDPLRGARTGLSPFRPATGWPRTSTLTSSTFLDAPLAENMNALTVAG